MSQQKMSSLLVIGECMMELTGDEYTYTRQFAGDTYNTAVYAKRGWPALEVQMMTAIGCDPISGAMMSQWQRDNVGDRFVMTTPDAVPGIYAISTDTDGERSFTYWRKDSAATKFMQLLGRQELDQLTLFDCIYFSGITLAILPDEDKATFLDLLAKMRQAGVQIAFDLNYRPALWRGTDQARLWLNKAYECASIALPGLADHSEIFAHRTVTQVLNHLSGFDIAEVVLKADDEGVFVSSLGEEPVHIQIERQQQPTDTTGAGDSFAGTYLAQRLRGSSIRDAVRHAANVASLVIQHHGAIVDEKTYAQALNELD